MHNEQSSKLAADGEGSRPLRGFEHNGRSYIVDPWGEVVAGPLEGEGMLEIACDPAGHYARPDLFEFKMNGVTQFGRR